MMIMMSHRISASFSRSIPAVHDVMGAYIWGARECLTITLSFINSVKLVGLLQAPFYSTPPGL